MLEGCAGLLSLGIGGAGEADALLWGSNGAFGVHGCCVLLPG